MGEYLWPAVAALCAVLAFLKYRPQPRVHVRPKTVRQLEARVAKFEEQKAALAALKTEVDEIRATATSNFSKMGERLNAVSADMSLLKGDWSTVKTKAGLKAITERPES